MVEQKEKKVEYLELIYDLIFVYIVGRNNSLLHNIKNGFVEGTVFLAYILCSFAIIQIWNFSTFYINMHGRNGVRDHIFLFINMYLLYYMGEGTRLHWQSFQNQYHTAWALILVNIGVQYLIEYRNYKGNSQVQKSIRNMMIVLFGEAALVLISIPVYNLTGIPISGVAILYGIIVTWIFADNKKARLIDFAHLSERAMLYVVFTFGEMIIAMATYFSGGFNFNSIFFSTACFLIVVGLFLCYGLLYDRIIDRGMKTNGMHYMMVHIFLIFALNCITTSLEFMRNVEVYLMPKILMLIGSFMLFFVCLFALYGYAKAELKLCKHFLLPVICSSAVFAALMLIFRTNMYVNICVSVIYIFTLFVMMYRFTKQKDIKGE